MLSALFISLLALSSQVQAADVDLQKLVNDVHKQFLSHKEGNNPTYIPALAAVDSDLFAISIVTAEGKKYSAGDINHVFSMQSIGKAFNLAALINQQGAQAVVDNIGVNATGLPFSSIMAIELNEERSVNPLVNAGAIATVSLIKAKNADKKWKIIESNLENFAGSELTVLKDIYKSETDTNVKNQSIARLLSNYGRLYDDIDESVDLYTRMCSVGINTEQLAIMGATYANAGINPMTKKEVVQAEAVPKLLAVMATSGLYDDSGLWLYKVGLPAKSGVGGGIIAVMPGKYGIAAFSPPVDAAGNSVRAQLAIEAIAKKLNANIFK
ncbi:L-glutamine amidohydrolase [Oleispira antarctica RB-8]|uniref:Glutaminase n=1 Tax=Oleispira antarctica RB-8 TaxID=698738 RepID=R4YKT1_OLEAN|nr:L-glutamine amidohydrolase [Oleispira antarctica RB-8]